MNKFYSRNYWSIGFQSSLYDRLSPECYFESMRRVVDCIPDGKSLSLLDAGCGSGLLLTFLEERIRNGLVYTGLDLLDSGVKATLLRAKELGIEATCLNSDLISPLGGEKFDVIVAHFCLYTLASDELREQALANVKSVLKTEGILIIVNPSNEYNADSIIEDSIRLVRERHGLPSSLFKQFLIYPFTKTMGLRFIQNQLRSKKWKGYTREEFSQEMEFAGFKVEKIEEVYAGSAFLGVGRLI